jgi:hypothetical protein
MGDKIFISYRRDDSRTSTDGIHRALLPFFGPDKVFFDVVSIPGGVNFVKKIHEEIGQCAVMLVVVGPRWVDIAHNGVRRLEDPDDYVRLEIKSALEAGLRVIPVLVEEARMPKAAQLPEALRDFAVMNAMQVRYARDFDGDIRLLIEAIEEGGAPTLATRQTQAAEAARRAQTQAAEAARRAQTEAERQREQARQQDLARQQAALQRQQEEQRRLAAAAAKLQEQRQLLLRSPLPWRFALLAALVIGVASGIGANLVARHFGITSTATYPPGYQPNDPLFLLEFILGYLVIFVPSIPVVGRYCRLLWDAPAAPWSGRVARRVVLRAILLGGVVSAVTWALFGLGFTLVVPRGQQGISVVLVSIGILFSLVGAGFGIGTSAMLSRAAGSSRG